MRTTDTSGVETPISIMFLMIAFLLIASIGSIFNETAIEEDISKLRLSQARSIGSSTIFIIDANELNNTSEVELDIIWDEKMTIIGEDPGNFSDCVASIVVWSSSIDWVVVSFRGGTDTAPKVNRDVVSWSSRVREDLNLWIFVPLDRSPVPQEGDIS